MADSKTLDRIRNLFAMSQDVSSPHEADIALRRCRSLMDKHGITEADLETSEFLAKVIGSYKKRPKWFSVLALGVARGNDVIISSTRDGRRGVLTSEFQGFEQDVLLAELMLEYLINTMDRCWAEFSRTHYVTGKGPHMSFNYGFACEMQTRLVALADERKARVNEATGTALVVVKNQLVANEFGMQRVQKRTHRVSDMGSTVAGRDAASRVSLNTQVGKTKQHAIAG